MECEKHRTRTASTVIIVRLLLPLRAPGSVTHSFSCLSCLRSIRCSLLIIMKRRLKLRGTRTRIVEIAVIRVRSNHWLLIEIIFNNFTESNMSRWVARYKMKHFAEMRNPTRVHTLIKLFSGRFNFTRVLPNYLREARSKVKLFLRKTARRVTSLSVCVFRASAIGRRDLEPLAAWRLTVW